MNGGLSKSKKKKKKKNIGLQRKPPLVDLIHQNVFCITSLTLKLWQEKLCFKPHVKSSLNVQTRGRGSVYSSSMQEEVIGKSHYTVVCIVFHVNGNKFVKSVFRDFLL